MSIQEIKKIINSLPLQNKLILIGSLISAFSMLLPVYSDTSQWGAGITYLGITGPLSLIGFSVIVFSLIPSVSILQNIIKTKFKKLSLENSSLISSLQTIFLLAVMSSIYLDSEFGVNITIKELRIGVILGFIGAIINLSGYYLIRKPHLSNSFTKKSPQEDNEDFMTLPNQIEDRIHKQIDELEKTNISNKKQILDRSNPNLNKENYNLRLNL